MGLDYSYLLYFQSKDLWTVVKGLTDYARFSKSPARIIFPDKVLDIPLDAWCAPENTFQYDADEIGFVLSMRIPVDDAIYEWLMRMDNQGFVDPQDSNILQYGYIGCIYLTIRQNLNRELAPGAPCEYVLFDFGTTGTRMSMLFFDSPEIRNTFTDILDNYNGICGVFNRENDGEVFWYKGRQLNFHVDDPFISIDAIKALLG